MNYLLDNPEAEQIFQDILLKIKRLQNRDVVSSMQKRGGDYKVNLGVSIPLLHQLASGYGKNHLVALKLWNKQWRETMILATLLEDPADITENQIDFWVRNFPSIEIAEQAAMNLFSKTGFAYQKAFEYCISKKLLVKIVGLLIIGRLALTDHESPDENFDPFLELMSPLSRDPQLALVFPRIFIQIGMRNLNLHELVIRHAKILKTIGSEVSHQNAELILQELDCEEIRAIVNGRQ
jgi:hypothetical protein